MSAKVNSIGLKGLEGYLVQVQVELMEGVESVIIVGLPDTSVKESRERVSASLHHMGHSLADKKVIVNLSPAEQKKNGPLFDLAIALGVLKSDEFIEEKIPKDAAFIGALSLDGSITPVQGMLPAVLAAKRLGIKNLFLPFDPELPHIEFEGLELIYVATVDDVLQHLAGRTVLPLQKSERVAEVSELTYEKDFRQIIGHEFAKRALEIAAAGGHHVMMDGPPGCGKSLLAETFATILPPLTKEAQLEKVSLFQLADAPPESLLLPPFCHPHHSASAVAIVGGGSNPKPGEVSLNYQNRVSGPIRDRIDVLLSLRPVQLKEPNFEEIESSETIRKRVSAARSKQYERYGEEVTNGEVVYERLLKTSRLNDRQHDLLQDLCMKYGLSNRVHIKVLRLARTIADLNGNDEITDEAILEALRLRKVEVDEGLRVSGGLRGGYDG